MFGPVVDFVAIVRGFDLYHGSAFSFLRRNRVEEIQHRMVFHRSSSVFVGSSFSQVFCMFSNQDK